MCEGGPTEANQSPAASRADRALLLMSRCCIHVPFSTSSALTLVFHLCFPPKGCHTASFSPHGSTPPPWKVWKTSQVHLTTITGGLPPSQTMFITGG